MHYGYQTWSEESLMQVYDDDNLHGGLRSLVVKCGKNMRCGRQVWSKELLMQV